MHKLLGDKFQVFFYLLFYCEMHYSVKHGLAIACHLSVRLSLCLSVMLVDHGHIG